MSILDATTHLALPLPHPSNDPYVVDVPRLRAALTLLDDVIYTVQTALAGKVGQAAIDAAVSSAVAQLVGSAPAALDALHELAAAIGNDPNFAATIASQLGLKATKSELDTAITQVLAQLKVLDDLIPTPAVSDAGLTLVVAPDGKSYVLGLIDLYTANLIPRVPRSSNTALARADKGKLIDATGTFTQTFASVSVLGDGWWCLYQNNGAGDVTFDPSGTQTIDGLTSFISYPGELRLIQCDGAALRSRVLSPGTKIFTSAGNFVWPPGINGAVVDCEAPGGGGGGGSAANGSSGAGGGGGGRESRTLAPQSPGTTTLAAPGASGAGGVGSRTSNVGATDGQNGGNSTFGDLVKAFGGKGGLASNSLGGAGGAAGFLDLVSSNSPVAGSFGAAGSSVSSDKGGSSGGRSGAASQPATGGGDAASGSSGGGGGGNSSSSPATRGGKAGPLEGGLAGTAGASGAAANGGAGGNGVDGAPGFGGSGGGGGGHAHPSASPQSTTNGNGGKGGNGGFPGGGGGGGGSCVNQASNGGDGGNGGAARIVVRMF